MKSVYVIGMAGSGKSVLTANFGSWLKDSKVNVISVNLDPGSSSLPYYPDVDVRNHVNIEDLMRDYQLGINGALVVAADMLGEHLEEIKAEIDEAGAEIVIFDTPGQIELFAFRESGPFVASAMGDEGAATLFLLDGPFCKRPAVYISNIFLAAAVFARLKQPQIYVLTKADLMTKSEVELILSWAEELEILEQALLSSEPSTMSIVLRDMVRGIYDAHLMQPPIPISAKQFEGFADLEAELTRILTGGEEPKD